MSATEEGGPSSPSSRTGDAGPVDVAGWRERIRRETFANYHFEMGRSLRRAGDLIPAVEAFQRAIDVQPDHALAHGMLVDILRSSGQPEAEARHALALSVDPRYATLAAAVDLADQAREHAARHDPERAQACLEQAYGLEPTGAARSMVADALLELGIARATDDHAAGLPLLERAAALAPDDPVILDRLSISYEVLSRWDDAIRCLEAALDAAPDHAGLMVRLASVLNTACRFEDAVTATRRALAASPGSGAARQYLATALIGLNRGREAVEAIQGVLAANASDSTALAILGLANLTAGDVDAAAAAMEKGLSVDAGNPVLQGWMGLVRQRQGRFQEALDLHKRAQETMPSLVMSRFDLALTLDAMGRGDEALVHHGAVFAQAGRRVEYWIRTRPWAAADTLAIYRRLGLT